MEDAHDMEECTAMGGATHDVEAHLAMDRPAYDAEARSAISQSVCYNDASMVTVSWLPC